MSEPSAKLAYVKVLFRVKVDLNKDVCAQTELPPSDLVKRTKSKLESVKKSGEIISYIIHDDLLNQCWARIREDKSLDPSKVISVVLGEGVPALNGVKITKSTNIKSLADLTILAPIKEVRHWRVECFNSFVNHQIGLFNPGKMANQAQVMGAYQRAIRGEKVTRLPLSQQPLMEDEASKPFSIIANKARKEVGMILRSMSIFSEGLTIDHVVKAFKDASDKILKNYGSGYRFLTNEVKASLETAMSGPEFLGIDLPVVVLGGVVVGENIAEKKATLPSHYPGAGKLSLKIPDNKMSAEISNFSLDFYDDPSFTVDQEWIEKELNRYGIAEKCYKPYLRGALEYIRKGEDLNEIIIAKGKDPSPGAKPYIFETYKQAAPIKEDLDKDIVDIRALQQRSIVKAGAVFAEVRYEFEPQQGYDIYGNGVEPKRGEKINVNLGENVEERDGKYYAVIDGIPVIDEKKIAISSILVHKGDVNLRTGNINFDGPVEILGSVDNGALIEATGDIFVKGTVRGAVLKSKGSIEVLGGVVTGEKGKISAAADIKAEFCENSKIQCGGNLLVKKAILNSQIIAGQSIEVLDRQEGLLAGGMISCLDFLKVANLGFKIGAKTKLNIGVDWKSEIAVRIREARIENLRETQAKDRASLREITSKRSAQMTAKHKEKKVYFQQRLQKIRPIIEKAEAHLEVARTQLTYNNNAQIHVEHNIHSNNEITISGNKVAIANDLAGVAIFGKKRRGSHILSIEEARAEEEAS